MQPVVHMNRKAYFTAEALAEDLIPTIEQHFRPDDILIALYAFPGVAQWDEEMTVQLVRVVNAWGHEQGYSIRAELREEGGRHVRITFTYDQSSPTTPK